MPWDKSLYGATAQIVKFQLRAGEPAHTASQWREAAREQGPKGSCVCQKQEASSLRISREGWSAALREIENALAPYFLEISCSSALSTSGRTIFSERISCSSGRSRSSTFATSASTTAGSSDDGPGAVGVSS